MNLSCSWSGLSFESWWKKHRPSKSIIVFWLKQVTFVVDWEEWLKNSLPIWRKLSKYNFHTSEELQVERTCSRQEITLHFKSLPFVCRQSSACLSSLHQPIISTIWVVFRSPPAAWLFYKNSLEVLKETEQSMYKIYRIIVNYKQAPKNDYLKWRESSRHNHIKDYVVFSCHSHNTVQSPLACHYRYVDVSATLSSDNAKA